MGRDSQVFSVGNRVKKSSILNSGEQYVTSLAAVSEFVSYARKLEPSITQPGNNWVSANVEDQIASYLGRATLHA